MKYFSMFSGIGGFEYGIEAAYLRQASTGCFYEITGIAPPVCPGTHASGPHLLKILVTPKLTNTQSKSTKNTMEDTRTMEMQPELITQKSQISTYLWVECLAKHGLLPVNVGALKMPVGRCGLNIFAVLKKSNQSSLLLKTLKESFPTMEGIPSLGYVNASVNSDTQLILKF